MEESRLIRLALPVPLPRLFDYLAPLAEGIAELRPGCRFVVPFGRQRLVGILIETPPHSAVPAAQLKRAETQLDARPIISDEMITWLQRVADYYLSPVGEVFFTALPNAAKKPRSLVATQIGWRVTALTANSLARAPKQRRIYELLRAAQEPQRIDQLGEGAREALSALQQKGLVESVELEMRAPAPPSLSQNEARPLNAGQQAAANRIAADLGRFAVHLLHGVTGSGKTEVYLHVAAQVLARGQQVLMLVPEIGLTPQTIARVRQRFGGEIGVWHSNITDAERARTWQRALRGELAIVIGTRSAVFAPLPNLGLIVIDEEHDGSYKQQEGLRYSARDITLMRAQRAGIPVILGSATPSLETMRNANEGRYCLSELTERVGSAKPPQVRLVDMRHEPKQNPLSSPLLTAMRESLSRDEQVLLFLNRRGYSPVWLCRACGWVARCPHCEYPLTYHAHERRLRCHHCECVQVTPAHCPECRGADFNPLGFGTERIVEELQRHFPAAEVIRIDRDTTQHAGALFDLLSQVQAGKPQILLGTQMLAKGHDFPGLTLVGILDADQGLFGADFRSAERLAQLLVQVAGRAGRADKSGQVLIQTHRPEHPLFHTLLNSGYLGFCREALAEREQAGFPPFHHAALVRADSDDYTQGMRFLQQCQETFAAQAAGVEMWGPSPAPMEKRAGRYRFQLLLLSAQRAALHRCLSAGLPAVETLPLAKRLRWWVDVDPLELS